MSLVPHTSSKYSFEIAYQFTYFVIVIVVLCQIIFGMIIDSFGELRTTRAQNKKLMENTCFICGEERSSFEKGRDATNGFQRHVAADHNSAIVSFEPRCSLVFHTVIGCLEPSAVVNNCLRS